MNAFEFILQLIEDTTYSTLLFDLLEEVSYSLSSLNTSLNPFIPPKEQRPFNEVIDECIFHPELIDVDYDGILFKIVFDLPCDLALKEDKKDVGKLHVTLRCKASFKLISEDSARKISLSDLSLKQGPFATKQLVVYEITPLEGTGLYSKKDPSIWEMLFRKQ